MANANLKQKSLEEGEYLVAIRTGINYWHILTGREYILTMEEAEEYASNFDNQFQTTILKVEKVTRKANGHTT